MDIRSLHDLVPHLEGFGDETALIDFTSGAAQRLSFAGLCAEARACAAGLLKRGMAPGDAAALFATNSVDWVVCRFALILADAVCVPVDFDADAVRLQSLLADSGARTLFAGSGQLAVARQALAQLGGKIDLILLGRAECEAGRALPGLRGLAAEPPARWPRADPDAVVSRFYTSGTTARPKAVPLTHANIVTNLRILAALKLAGPAERILLPLPLHHAFPFIVGLLLPLSSGAPVVFPRDVSGPALLQAMKEADVTVIVGVPRLYRAMLEGIENRLRQAGPLSPLLRGLYALSRLLRRRLGLRWGRILLAPVHARVAPGLHLLASGGARLEEGVAWRLEGLGYQVLSGYGLVETSSVACFNRPGANLPGSAGKPPEGVDIRIADVPGMEDGEVQIRGPVVFSGYAGDEEANAAAFTADGWFRTGDLGRFDAAGFLHISGRLKEIIVLAGGKNIEPEMLEKTYREHPLIKEIAVLERDDALVALVVPDLDAAREAAGGHLATEIRVALTEKGRALPAYMRLAGMAMTRDELPRNPLGKYKRHQLPALYDRAERGEQPAAGALSQADEQRVGSARGQRLMGWLRFRFPGRTVHPDTALQMDLGIDSLAWVEFGLELEAELGVALDEDAASAIVTVRDLLDAVAAAGERPAVPGDVPGKADAEAQARWLAEPGPAARVAGSLLYGLNWLAMRALMRLGAEGLEHVPARGPLIIAANHASDLDPVVLAALLPHAVMRNVWWGADRRRVFGSPLGRALARPLHFFPVDDHAPGPSLARAAAMLAIGRILVWFPESWRSPDGEVKEFRPGVGVLLERSGAPVLPCLITGTFALLPRHASWPRPGAVHCRFGRPIAPEVLLAGSEGKSDPAARHAAVAAAVREAVLALGRPDA